MSWIPKLMLYYQGERVAFADIFLLDKPLLTGAYVDGKFTVTITNKNENYVYLYTLDGSEPSKDSPIFDTVTVDDVCTIKVQAFDGVNKSPIVIYKVVKVKSPMLSSQSVSYGGPLTVTITCSTADATIYYKIGESGTYTEYTGAFTIDEATEIFAYATKAGMLNSDVASTVIQQVQTPVIYDPETTVEDVVISIIKG